MLIDVSTQTTFSMTHAFKWLVEDLSINDWCVLFSILIGSFLLDGGGRCYGDGVWWPVKNDLYGSILQLKEA